MDVTAVFTNSPDRVQAQEDGSAKEHAQDMNDECLLIRDATGQKPVHPESSSNPVRSMASAGTKYTTRLELQSPRPYFKLRSRPVHSTMTDQVDMVCSPDVEESRLASAAVSFLEQSSSDPAPPTDDGASLRWADEATVDISLIETTPDPTDAMRNKPALLSPSPTPPAGPAVSSAGVDFVSTVFAAAEEGDVPALRALLDPKRLLSEAANSVAAADTSFLVDPEVRL
jgi:hypothetical protein